MPFFFFVFKNSAGFFCYVSYCFHLLETYGCLKRIIVLGVLRGILVRFLIL